jgi:Transposase
MTPPSHDTFAAFSGIDWADARHEGCLPAAGTAKRECFELEHPPEAIDAWVTTLRTRFQGQPLAVCLALDKGPLGSALRKYDFLVLFPINPLTLARSREAFTPSRAKDAPTDAALQLELLLTQRDKLQPLQPQSPPMRALAQLVEHRRRVVGDKVRITNRLTSALKNDCPQVLQWFQDKDTRMVCDFLSRWPTLKAAQLARRSILERFLRDPPVRTADVLATRLHAIKTATPLTPDEGGIAPNALLVQTLVSQLRVTWDAIEAFDQAIAPRAQPHPAFPLLQALPGAGPVCASRRLGAFGEQRERYASAAALQK